ncbi:MAG: hypoxanthine-guanine phosphoribosyltransferase [Legionellales bacterium]|nr:hypoxanthine-guanine phosphoribosyltransferase [Legionellales bacterium]
MSIPSDIQEVFNQATCLHTREEVEAAIDRMANEITRDLHAKHPVVLCVMIGGVIPTAGLLSRMEFPLELDYVHTTRYGKETHASALEWRKEPTIDLTDRTVLIVDEILDGGLTLSAIIEYCQQHQAREVYSAVLVDKMRPREEGGIAEADYYGLKVIDKWLFGYGMDYKEYLRNAPGIYAVADHHL